MARLMWIAGIIFAAVGIALGLMVFFSTASIMAWGIQFDTAVLLLVGGLLAIGLGGVINALDAIRDSTADLEPVAVRTTPIPEYRRAAEAQTAAAAREDVSPEVRATIEKIERAKKDLTQAFGDSPAATAPAAAATGAAAAVIASETIVAAAPAEAAAEAAIEEIEEAMETVEVVAEPEPEADGEEQLYVVEERVIRSRPARILSDGTVEAETDEGWMRFENLEHLDEYLEAMSPTH